MSTNSLYFAMQPLQQTIFNKTTGEPLAGGIVTYYTNSSMTTKKDVFQQDSMGNFVVASNPLILSGFGSFVDSSGFNFTPIAYPWTIPDGQDGFPGAAQSYFIYVTDADGAFQFSVTDWPLNSFNESSDTVGAFTPVNQITNPQFAETLFSPKTSVTITVPSGATTTPIAPGWFIKTTGAGDVILTQNTLTDSIITEAPYSLTINVGSGITTFAIYQRIDNSPRLFAASSVGGFFAAASSTGVQLTMTYEPSTGIPTTIVSKATGFTNVYDAISGAASISPPINLDSPTTGYVDIVITPNVLPNIFSITSVQILPVANISEDVLYSEVSVPIQKSLDSYYWLPKLEYKPIPSYLVGWDFPLNPYQAQGTSSLAAQALGANTSYYIADQTILYQTLTSGFTTIPVASGLQITGAKTNSFAVIQYVNPTIVQELLSQRMSVQIKCSTVNTTTQLTPFIGTVSLWWTAGAIPTITSGGSYASLFTAISSTGVPTATSGWTQVPNTYPTQSFTVPTTSTAFDFSGFDATSQALVSGAVNFAIAITFSNITATNTLTLNYCSLVGGDIATRPAPQSSSEVLLDCQYYYQSSFAYGTAPAAAAGGGIYSIMGGSTGPSQIGPSHTYPTPLRTNPVNLVTLYNPTTASNNDIRNLSGGGSDWTGCSVVDGSSIAFATGGTATGTANGLLAVNFASDARLGVI